MADKQMEVALVLSAYDRATRVINTMTNNAIGKMAQIKKSSEALSKDAFSFGRDTGAAGLAIAGPIVAATTAAAMFEDKMADVAKVMSLKIGSKEFMEMSTQAKDLSIYLGKMPEDAAGLMASLAAGGVVKKDMADVAKIAGEMGVAFGISSELAGEQFVKSKNALGGTVPEIKKMMDAINHLSDNDASEAAQILDFMAAGGSGVAKTLKVAAPEMSAFGSSLISMGKSGAESATIMERFQKGIFQNAGMKKIFDDAGGGAKGMMAILEKGSKMSGQEQFEYFNKFGQYGVNIMQMAQSLGHVKDNMKLVGNENNYLNSVSKEFNNRSSTTIGQFGVMKAELMVVAINLGETLLPAVIELMKEIKPMVQSFSAWVKENKGLVTTLMKAAAAIAALLLTVSALSFGVGAMAKVVSVGASSFSFILKGVKLFQYGIFALRYTMVTQVMPALISFNATLLANPIGAIVAAIVVMIAVVAILVIKWKEITKWYKESATWLKILLIPLMVANSAIILLAFSIRKVIDNWPAIKNFFTNLPKLVTGLYAKFKSAGAGIAKAIWEGIKSAANMPIEAISKITKTMREYLPFSPAKRGAFTDLHKVKIVETIAGSMRPAPLVKAMGNTTQAAAGVGGGGAKSGGGGGGITINYSPVINGGGNNADIKNLLKENADYLVKLLESKMANKARLSY